MPFSEITAIGPPRPDQIEICVFGPSYGECIVVHIGNGHWIVVDSCLYAATKEPVSLAYLRALGIDPASAIKAIIATHWHDDHCRGLSQVLLAAPTAHVWIASALTDFEFLRFAARMGKNNTAIAGNKLKEFSKIIDDINSRHSAGLLTLDTHHPECRYFDSMALRLVTGSRARCWLYLLPTEMC
jgi:glyoxylase-like metal-dependent hydrolase (beta-lactamase superfamily II)